MCSGTGPQLWMQIQEHWSVIAKQRMNLQKLKFTLNCKYLLIFLYQSFLCEAPLIFKTEQSKVLAGKPVKNQQALHQDIRQ